MSKILNFNLWTILHENMSRMNFAEKRFDKIPISSPGSFWLLASGMVVITSKVHHLPTVAHNCRGKRNNLAAKEITFVARLSLTYSFCREVFSFAVRFFSFAVRFFLLSKSFSFAVRFFLLPWGFFFCLSLFLLPWGFFFCRVSFSFAARFFLLPRVFFFLPRGFFFCREVFSFVASFSFCRDSCRGNRTYLLLGDHTTEKEPRRGGSNCAFCSVYTLHNYPRMSPLL